MPDIAVPTQSAPPVRPPVLQTPARPKPSAGSDPLQSMADQLPAVQQQYGQVTQALSQATGDAIKAKAELGQKTAGYQSSLEQQAADSYKQAASGVHFEKAPQFAPPRETLQGLAALFSMVMTMAFAGGRGAKDSGMAALAGMTGALKGYREGNQQLFQNSLQQYNENLRKVQEDNQANMQMLDQIKQAYAVDRAKIPALVAEFQAKNGDSYISALVQQGKLGVASDYLGKLLAQSTNVAMKSKELTQQLAVAQMHDATQRQIAAMRDAATIRAAQMRMDGRLGMVPGQNGEANGAPSIDSIAKAIANYQMQVTPYMLRVPAGRAIMAEVLKINPNYDAKKYPIAQKTIQAFTTGQQGNMVRSLNVVMHHLNTLNEIYKAMGNGNIPLQNALLNKLSKETGDPEVTSFEAAQKIVGKELVKAIVLNGGGVTERREAENVFNNRLSPQQFAGVVNTYKSLLGAQLQGLGKEYESAGLNDFARFLAPDVAKELGYSMQPAATPDSAQPSGNPPVQINSQQEYDKLPKGSRYFFDGKLYIKGQ